MKKSIALLALAFGVTGAFAQDLTSKKGEPILPEAEDWAIGVDAVPFLNYAGNFIGGNGSNTAPSWNNYGANNTIVAKKFIDAQNAYRVTFRLGMRNQSFKHDVLQPVASTSAAVNFPTKATTVEDKASSSSTFIGIGVGKEMRKGKTRLQGFYGADVFIWYSSSKMKFKYANNTVQQNALGTVDPDVDPNNASYSTDWSTQAPATFTASNLGSGITNITGAASWRKLSEKPGGQFGLGIRAFIGAEYFILAKISIGAEYGWGIGLKSTGDGTMKTESFDVPSNGALITTAETGGKKWFGLDTDLSGNMLGTGSIRIMFHF